VDARDKRGHDESEIAQFGIIRLRKISLMRKQHSKAEEMFITGL